MHTGLGTSTDVMFKTISALKDVEVFSFVFRDSLGYFQKLNAALRSCDIETKSAFRNVFYALLHGPPIFS